MARRRPGPRTGETPPKLLRRSRFLVAWWRDGALRVLNYASGAEVRGSPLHLALLNTAGAWRSATDLAAALSEWPPGDVEAGIARLWGAGLLTGPGGESPAERELSYWRDWNPVAGLYHLATKDAPYVARRDVSGPPRLRPTLNPYPDPPKAYPGLDRQPLPDFGREDPLARVLLERRTWRRFGPGRIRIDEVSDLLGLTWGVQRWLHLGDDRLALKTSPSGGARHPLEAYVVVQDVSGLDPGLYYYDPDDHALVRLGGLPEPDELAGWLVGQDWYTGAPMIVFMTALFQRTRSRYGHPRAYRVVLLEAGHFCQTFCLLATRAGLAPFCTAALADSAIERGLGLDGVSESVLYAVGVGVRPEGLEWAAYPDRDNPDTSPPGHAVRAP